jgi:hypothetical protein
MGLKNDEKKCLNKLSKSLYHLWAGNKLCDVTLHVEQSKYLCHKVVILAHCPPFKSKILSARGNEQVEIYLPHSTKQGINQIISYFYTNEIHIHLFNFADILITSNDLGIDELFQKCELYILNYIDERKDIDDDCDTDKLSLIVRSLSILQPINKKKIYKKIMAYVASNFDCLMQTDDFLELNFGILNSFLSCFNIGVNTEEDLLEGILKWIRKDVKNRVVYQKQLLLNINFQFISPCGLKKFELSKRLMETPSIKQKVKQAHV